MRFFCIFLLLCTLSACGTERQTVDLSTLDFDYEINGCYYWKPLHIYNDGHKTYIKLPDCFKNSELPFLVVKDKTPKPASFTNGSYIVDSVFQKAVLFHGEGPEIQTIIIKKRG